MIKISKQCMKQKENTSQVLLEALKATKLFLCSASFNKCSEIFYNLSNRATNCGSRIEIHEPLRNISYQKTRVSSSFGGAHDSATNLITHGGFFLIYEFPALAWLLSLQSYSTI